MNLKKYQKIKSKFSQKKSTKRDLEYLGDRRRMLQGFQKAIVCLCTTKNSCSATSVKFVRDFVRIFKFYPITFLKVRNLAGVPWGDVCDSVGISKILTMCHNVLKCCSATLRKIAKSKHSRKLKNRIFKFCQQNTYDLNPYY